MCNFYGIYIVVIRITPVRIQRLHPDSVRYFLLSKCWLTLCKIVRVEFHQPFVTPLSHSFDTQRALNAGKDLVW